VDALDDVAALAELAQGRLGGRVHRPLAGPELVRETEPLQTPQSSDLERFERIRLASRIWCEIDDSVSIGIAGELPVELGSALGVDLALERATDVEIAAQPQLLRHQVLGPGTHPLLDVVARNDEVLAVVGDAAHDDVDVGMLRIPVIDSDPIELGAEILLHLADQLAGEALEVGHLRRVLGRDDEAEVMAVLLAPLREGLGVGVLGLGTEQPGPRPTYDGLRSAKTRKRLVTSPLAPTE
jgi:hypothetical protein